MFQSLRLRNNRFVCILECENGKMDIYLIPFRFPVSAYAQTAKRKSNFRISTVTKMVKETLRLFPSNKKLIYQVPPEGGT